ncbi:recombinase family protein [Amycolatopsis roodepoortensis]|uniref:recombinase family protein n=1 Tax=Amycolatopsis roodepoortensis TaxID=700274 RepID=UPI00214C03EB|nr:recombinase family protein [Amycolatopsis roodepoortensis]UUV33611.1 recombinase family protein [Amycolatopsis roodepoortensis]
MTKALTRRLSGRRLSEVIDSGEYPQLRAVIYARASNAVKGRKVSVASQIATGRKFCSQHGIAVVAVLVDNNLSGSRYATEERQDYNEALRLLSTGQANTLWTWENSRAQRNLSVFAKLRDILEKVGGYWAYDDRIYDMNDPDDRIDTAEDAVDAERESEKIRKRTRRGVEARAMEGLWAGPLGYGYRIVYDQRTGEAHREVDPETAPFAEAIVDRLIEEPNASVLVRELIEAGVPCARGHVWRADHVKKLQHLSKDPHGWAKLIDSLSTAQQEAAYEALVRARKDTPSQVAQQMNREQWDHPLPGEWNVSKVRNIALSPVIAGLRVFRKQIIGKGVWQPIISDRKRALIVARLGDPSRSTVRDGTRVKYLQTGILLCGICETPTRSTPLKRARPGYRCPHGHLMRDMERTDAYVVEAVLSRLESEDARELFRYEDQADELTKAVATARELRARLDGFTDSAANGGIGPERLSRIEAKLVPQIEAAEERVRQIGVSPVVADLLGADARTVWAGLSLSQQREVLRAVVTPRLLPTKGGRAPFNPDDIMLTWLGAPVAIPGVDDSFDDEVLAEVS